MAALPALRTVIIHVQTAREERITSYEAFRAVTKDAAWQYFEEHRKGTLEPGKLADKVILSADPMAIDPMCATGNAWPAVAAALGKRRNARTIRHGTDIGHATKVFEAHQARTVFENNYEIR